ncbi:DNA repair protein SWI5-like protein [Smittium culicis]|uniref:DNA repair protein SWI5-like protein n=1 Tax=Smittium culicis TaxID=133412 RepID=A0A1R1YI42_9FUNG|nr:DNA repair protein SWI5-like protein [Smittium culicis]
METPTKARTSRPISKSTAPDLYALEAEIEQLKAELDTLKTEHALVAEKWGYPVQDAQTVVKNHIEHLHLYNETKDAAQLILGKLAEIQGKSIKQIHAEFNISSLD